ncbi:DUF4339 domain-containing protein [Flavobacteriales bacterium]|nr:DUF4339 domain-containing protein [Flavobacteriales bacterium]
MQDPKRESSSKYFYAVGEEQIGPHSLAEIESKILDGEIKPETKVWTKGMADWLAAENVDAISGTFEEIPPPLSIANSINDETPPPLDMKVEEETPVAEANVVNYRTVVVDGVEIEMESDEEKPAIIESEIFSKKNPNWHKATASTFVVTGLMIIALIGTISNPRAEPDGVIGYIVQPVLNLILLRSFYRYKNYNFRAPFLTGLIINIIALFVAAIISILAYESMVRSVM